MEGEFAKGYEEGFLQGYEKRDKELFLTTCLLQKMADALLEKKKGLLEDLKPDLIEFSLAISEKIIRSELTQKEKLAKLIEQYVAFVTYSQREERVKLFLNPSDLLMVEEYLKRLEVKSPVITKITFVADSALQRGDIKIETKAQLLNATISREMEDLRSKLLKI